MSLLLRPAREDDLPAVARLIEPHVASRKLLPRSREELLALVPNAFVVEEAGELLGFAGIEIYSRKLAEILCLAVREGRQGRGVGRMLVEACVERAREGGVYEVLAISSAEPFLRACGFDFSLPEEKKAFFLRLREGWPGGA